MKAGILTRKAAAKKQKIHSWLPVPSGTCRRASSEKVRPPMASELSTAVAIAAESISREPTRV